MQTVPTVENSVGEKNQEFILLGNAVVFHKPRVYQLHKFIYVYFELPFFFHVN